MKEIIKLIWYGISFRIANEWFFWLYKQKPDYRLIFNGCEYKFWFSKMRWQVDDMVTYDVNYGSIGMAGGHIVQTWPVNEHSAFRDEVEIAVKQAYERWLAKQFDKIVFNDLPL